MTFDRNRSRSPLRVSTDNSNFTELWTHSSDLMSMIVISTPKTANESHPWCHAHNQMMKVLKSICKILPEEVMRNLKPPVRDFISSSSLSPQNDAETLAVTNDAANDEIIQSNEPPSVTLDETLEDVAMETTNTPKPQPRRSEPKHPVITEKFAVFISKVAECTSCDPETSHQFDMECATKILEEANISNRPMHVRRVGVERKNRPRFLVISFDNAQAQNDLLNSKVLESHGMKASLPRENVKTQIQHDKSKKEKPKNDSGNAQSKIIQENIASKTQSKVTRSQPFDKNTVCVFLKNVPNGNDRKLVSDLYSELKISGEPTYIRRVGKPKPGVSQYLVIGVKNSHQQKQILQSKFLSKKNIKAELPNKKTFFRGQSKSSSGKSSENGPSKQYLAAQFQLFQKFEQFMQLQKY